KHHSCRSANVRGFLQFICLYKPLIYSFKNNSSLVAHSTIY
uniref:Uncharacterized protein n=1 Tax=Latimeria chalumnae TaxID=7897 RepID=H3A2S7_LATCH